jgi:hypothetical protein
MQLETRGTKKATFSYGINFVASYSKKLQKVRRKCCVLETITMRYYDIAQARDLR